MGFISDLDRTIKSSFKVGQNWLKSVAGKLTIRNSSDDGNAALICEALELSGNVGSDRSVRIQQATNQAVSYTLSLPPNNGNTGDALLLSVPGALTFGLPSGGNAATLEGFTPAQLRDRSSHTGTQPISTITGLGSAALASASSFVGSNDPRMSVFGSTQTGLVPAPGSGSGRFLREDGTWQVISNSGGGGDFINGGNTANANLSLGTNNSFGVNFKTNDLSRISINPNGSVNIWDGQNRYASSDQMQPGSLIVGSTSRNYGGGRFWNSNTAGLLFECSDEIEAAIHDSGTRLSSIFYYQGSLNRVTWGRDMGWGVTNQHRFINKSLLVSHKTDFDFYNLNYPVDENSRTNLVVAGVYPHIYLISNQVGNGNHGNGLSFAEIIQGSSSNARHWNFAQANYGKRFQLGYVEGADFNPHLGIQGSETIFSIVAPGQSANLGNKIGISLNGKLEAEYNLDLNEGSIGWGINNTRTERKDDAGASNSLSAKQSGFFDTANPSNFYPGANSWQHLIDCRHNSTPSYALQIATSFWSDFSGLWWRATGGYSTQSWNRFVAINSNNQSNGWLTRGNNNVDSGQEFIGTTNNADLVFKRNNVEAFRVPSQNVIQINCQNGFGTPSRPHYGFYGSWGEDDGMYLESNGVLGFSVEGTKRLSITASNNRIEAHGFAFRTDQGYWVNNDRLLREKSATTINTLPENAPLNDIISALNSVIQVLKNHHTLFS
ncbi:MAG TPA: hypothetical protein DCY88_07725 [Cyanobacteria bacterium UBA11372]|nr:hypothetical protein [Cyanobacteria bacterium UBA11372]